MLDVEIPDLTFPMVKYGAIETPWDLRVLLYKGGAKGNSKAVFNEIAQNKMGRPIHARMELVTKIYAELTARLVGGGAKASASSNIKAIRAFFSWADEFDQQLSIEEVEDSYRHWSDYLLERVRAKIIKNITAYHKAILISSILDVVLDRSQPLIFTTRLSVKKRSTRAMSVVGDKQSLTDTFRFGHLCLDVIKSLSYEAIFGSLPVKIQFRDGREIEHWSGLRDPAKLVAFQPGYKNKFQIEKVKRLRANWEADLTLNSRHPLINLRILAEMMVFIGQTGMNLAQAHNLTINQYSYRSTSDGYDVRTYKNRRKGEVLFSIYNEYRELFEKYLAWRKKVFGETSNRLFPFIRKLGALETSIFDFKVLRYVCKIMGITFVSPQKLRNTRVNWLLRQSRAPDQTAEQAQHMKQTLLQVYEKPSLQVAQVEIIEFWKKNDPRLIGMEVACPAPGSCNGVPTSILELPSETPKPDCSNPSGCLFCSHHRDVDSEDYVWSTASMRHLNVTILPRFHPPAKTNPDSARHVQMVIDVLTAKLKWFRDSNATRKSWVEEAQEKLNEGHFHIHWRHLIESAE
jgi:integrase